MEKKYITPDMEIAEFTTEDVITTSPPIYDDPNTPGGEGWG